MKTISAGLLFLLYFLISCCQTKFSDHNQIDLTEISSIKILKVTGPPDTIKCFWKDLTEQQIKSFTDKWNKTTGGELKKYLSTYKIAVYFKNDSVREFRANGQFIKENNDWCLNFQDKYYFEKLYSDTNLNSNK
jgi:hypothetical protein